jgi:hypothetical protein
MKTMKLMMAVAAFALPLGNATARDSDKTDAQLRKAIESRTWYSARHAYRFEPNGAIAVDGYVAPDQRWSIHNALLYRVAAGTHFPPTKIIEINDRQLVEQEISGPYKRSVEVMYSNRPSM